MKEKLYTDSYEAPQLDVFTVEIEGLLCVSGDPGAGGIEGGESDEL